MYNSYVRYKFYDCSFKNTRLLLIKYAKFCFFNIHMTLLVGNPQVMNCMKKFTSGVDVFGCVLKFSFNTKPNIFNNVQIWWLYRPGDAIYIIISLIFFNYVSAMYRSIVILKLVRWRVKTGQRLFSRISWYFTALIFPFTLHKVPTPCNVTQPHIITDTFLWTWRHMHSGR